MAALGPRHIIVSAEYGHMVKKLLKVTQSEISQLVVKGNLRHRIEKLGTEKEDNELTDSQMQLRHIARAMQKVLNDLAKPCALPESPPQATKQQPPPERPSWANGAFLYLTPLLACIVHTGMHI